MLRVAEGQRSRIRSEPKMSRGVAGFEPPSRNSVPVGENQSIGINNITVKR
jgi:hypothetical protein